MNTASSDKRKSKEDKRAAALRDNLKKRKAKAKEDSQSRKEEDK